MWAYKHVAGFCTNACSFTVIFLDTECEDAPYPELSASDSAPSLHGFSQGTAIFVTDFLHLCSMLLYQSKNQNINMATVKDFIHSKCQNANNVCAHIYYQNYNYINCESLLSFILSVKMHGLET